MKEYFRSKKLTPQYIRSQEYLNKVAHKINKTLPKMLDRGTQLKRTIGQEGKLTYVYVLVNRTADEISYGYEMATQGQKIRKGVCTSPEMEILLKNGVELNYAYYGKDSKYIGKISVAPTDCGF